MESDLFEKIFSEAGLVAALLFFSNIVWYKMYHSEKEDRKSAWRANNEFRKEVVEAMKEVVPVLAILKDRHKRD